MTIKTIHTDAHGDVIAIYRTPAGSIFVDASFVGESIVWRGVFKPEQAREIANRLNQLADIIEGK